MKPRRTILCVDDNEQLLSIRKVMLETRGYRVVACTNGIDALEHSKQGGIDLILADLLMPGLDGHKLIPTSLCRRACMRRSNCWNAFACC